MSDSPGLDLNFGGTEASSGFKPMPEGTYDAVVYEHEVRDTKDKDGVKQLTSDGQQARYLNVTYKITEGEFKGRYQWGIHSIRFPADPADDTEKERQTREIFLSWLNTISGEDFSDSQKKIDFRDFYGNPVRLVLTQDSWEGEIKNKIKRVLPPEDSEDSLDAARSRSL